MILQDLTEIWYAARTSTPIDGEISEVFTDLRSIKANVQVMSNAMQLKTYGEITDGAIEIRTDNPPDFKKGDPIYLKKPERNSEGNYPDGDFRVDSIKPSYIGGFHIHNPTVTTASAVTK